MDYQKAISNCLAMISFLRADRGEQIKTRQINRIQEDTLKTAISAMKELDQYKQLGTLEEVRMAVERQIPESPTLDGDGYAPDGTFVWDEWLCPNCKCRYELEYDDYDYCPTCGQHIRWEGDKT